MTILGDRILKALNEQMSKTKQSSIAAGAMATSGTAASANLRKNLEAYFENLVYLPPLDPKALPTYSEIEKRISTPKEKYLKSFGDSTEIRDVNVGNKQQEPVLFSKQTIEEVRSQEQSLGGGSQIKRERALDTEADWKKLQKDALETFSSESIAEATAAKNSFDAFITECMEPKNLPTLVKIITTIEQIAQNNLHILSQIGDSLKPSQNNVHLPPSSDTSEHSAESLSGVSLDETRSSVASFDSHHEEKPILDTQTAQGLAILLEKTRVDANTANYIIEAYKYLAQNPSHIVTALELANTMNEQVFPLYDEDDFNSQQNIAISKALAPFKEINSISELFKIRASAEAKNSSMLRKFMQLIGVNKMHLAGEYLALRSREDISAETSRYTRKTKPGA